jgi:hypothetical protein
LAASCRSSKIYAGTIGTNFRPALQEEFSGSRNFQNKSTRISLDLARSTKLLTMTSRPPSASSRTHPTPHQTTSRSRSLSSTKVPPQAPKPSRRAADPNPPNPLFTLGPPTLVPRASCGKSDDILGPPDTQSSPFVKAGLKMQSVGPGPYGELEGILEWPPELYAVERMSW